MADIPLQVISENAASERRITPSWTIGQLKARLEPITGVPPLSQRLSLKVQGQDRIPIEAIDEENTRLSIFPLSPYAELHVSIASPRNCCRAMTRGRAEENGVTSRLAARTCQDGPSLMRQVT